MPDVVPDGKRPRSILNQRTRTPASFEIADANASVSNITFPDEDLDLHEVGGACQMIFDEAKLPELASATTLS